MDEPIKLEIFTDYVWPWCYLSTVRSGSDVSSSTVSSRNVSFWIGKPSGQRWSMPPRF